ncbi:MAG: hypothetical protein J6S45_07495 [Firmicutes bacterium]|nr:hypothetical protein [Bacillota bacterium]
MLGRIWAWMNRHSGLVIFLMLLVIISGAVATMGVFDDDREDRYNQLIAAYEFISDEEVGIGTWDSEEAWKTGMNEMMDLCPKEMFQNSVLYGDNEVLRTCLRNVRRVKFGDDDAAEIAELVEELEVEDNSKWGMYRCKVDKKQVKEINYLTGIRMIY